MKTFYADYVNHMMRFYCRGQRALKSVEQNGKTLSECFKSDTDRLNWSACERVMSELLPAERAILIDIYAMKEKDVVANVQSYCERTKSSKANIWQLIQTVSTKIALERGLIDTDKTV